MENQTVKLDKTLPEAVNAFEKAVAGYLSGALAAENFKAARVEMGVYAQRQKDYYMLRTRLPGGQVTAEALEKYAELAQTLPTGSVHLTTRQDIQLHFVRIAQAPALMRKLAEAGVGSSGAGGNTIRNITACHHPGGGLSGRAAAVASALNNYFCGHELSRGLPRKFKISVCFQPGCYAGLTDDLAFVPAKSGQAGKVDVYAGGGQGSAPKLGALLEKSFPLERINQVVLAALKVFNRHGTRKNRSRARLKYLVERIGWLEFVRLYSEERDTLEGLEPLEAGSAGEEGIVRQAAGREMLVQIPGGDLTVAQLNGLAGIVSENGLSAQVTKNADLLLAGVEPAVWGAVLGSVNRLGLNAAPYTGGNAIATCNGSVTCSEGITNSRGLSLRLEDILRTYDGPAVSIRVSGCHNACSGHHTADIGLQGSARRVNGRLIPHYVVSAGGSVDGEARLARQIGRIPARNVPAAVRGLLGLITSASEGESSAAPVIARLDEEVLASALKAFELADEDLALHGKDWDMEEDFNVDEVGPGECAGSALDIIDGYFEQARRDVHSAEKAENPGEAAKLAHRGAVLSARALLVKYGVDPATDLDAVEAFKSTVIGADENPAAWGMATLALTLPIGGLSAVEPRLAATRAFFDKCHEAYTIAAIPLANAGQGQAGELVRMDLSGVACPFNYTKIKLKLETLPVGARIEALVDDGAPIRNVPRSLENDGQKVISIHPKNGRHLILLEKAC